MQMKTVVMILSLALLASCAATEQVEKTPELYWPLPPERPRIKFVDIIRGSSDVEVRYAKVKGFLFGEDTSGNFSKPFGVTARRHRMYVTDIGMVHVLDFEQGKYQTIGASELRIPAGIAASDDKVFVGDIAKKRIFAFDREGKVVMSFGANEIDAPGGLAVDEKRGRLLVTDARKNAVLVYGLDGKLLFSFGTRGERPGEFNIPYGVATDKEGRIYVVDSANFRLQIFDREGKFLKAIGSVGTSPGNFARPKGVAVDSDGNIYVLDAAFGNFQIFDLSGNVLLAVGTTGSEPGEFMLPSSISIDESDRIYVVDQVNKRVQIFQYLREGLSTGSVQ